MGMTRWVFRPGEKERGGGVFFAIVGLSLSSVFFPVWLFYNNLGFSIGAVATIIGWMLMYYGVKIIRRNDVKDDKVTIPLIAIFLGLALLWQGYVTYAYVTDNNPYRENIELSGLSYCPSQNATATEVPRDGYIGKIENCMTACKKTFPDSKKWFYDFNSITQPRCICYRCD